MKAFTAVLILFSSLVYAQPAAKLSGEVTDGANPLASATISLLLAKDSGIAATAVTNSTGRFELNNLKQDHYILVVSMIGYKKNFRAVHINQPAIQMPAIHLEKDGRLMQDIRISAKKPFIEQKIDRTVMNVDALISNAGVTALEVLENAPGLLVDADNGSISLKGKSGVQIFIDDKPTYLSGNDLLNYLKTLPSGSLDKIEIMTNPPARYSAAGNAGVINIKTKRNKTAGFNGSMSTSYSQGVYPRSNNSLNFNYRNNKVNFFGTGSYTLGNSFNDLDIYRYYFGTNGQLRSTFFQNSYIRRTSWASSLKLGVDFYADDKTTLGILVSGISRPSQERTFNKSFVRNAAGNTDSVITADNSQDANWKNGSVNLNYVRKFNNNGRELSADFDHVRYNSDNDQAFLNAIYGPANNLKSTDKLVGALPSNINIYSFKSDYSHPLGSGSKIEGGAKISYVATDNAANYFILANNGREVDYDKTNHFLYDETINAAYLNFNKEWSRFSFQSGLRFENTISDGQQLGNAVKPDSSFRRSYNNIFPTVYFLFKADSNTRNQFALSYGKRIDRPVYQDLNPFVSPLDKFSLYVGNPYLRPTITNVFELSHIFKNKVTTTLSYSQTKDVIQESIDLSNSIYISRPANIGKSSVLGLSVSASLNAAKWWTNNIYAEIQNRKFRDMIYGYFLDTSAVYFGTNLTSQFTLSKTWTAELSGNYRTGILVGQIISSQTGGVNIGFAKKLFNNKATARLSVRDVFYTRLNHGIITSIKNAYATYHNWGDSRQYVLSFSYNFGKAAGSQRRRNTGSESEQNRVRN